MATQIQTWQIVDGQLHRVEKRLADAGRTETFDLEAWIASHPSIVEEDLLIIGRQVQTKSGPLDLLAVDRRGSLVVLELKRDKLPREVLTQAIDYASDVASWTVDKLSEVCTRYTGKSLEDSIAEAFPDLNLENLNINEAQRIVLVGFAVEASLERMINWLSTAYNFDINAVILHYILTSSGDELLAKTAVISEEVVGQRVRSRKFQIPMSDEPGAYDKDELFQMLKQYLSQDMKTPRRIRAKRNLQFQRRYSHPVDRSTGLVCDQTIVLTTLRSAQGYPDPLRRIRYKDAESGKTLVFLSNNFALPALTIAELYRSRWQIELFFKWIKQHLRIKAFYGTSENAVKTQIWTAISTYVLVAILKKRLGIEHSLYTILQILSVTLFEKTPVAEALSAADSTLTDDAVANQLQLFTL